ncbi:MAG: uroporphyrinogen-III synthase [Anaerolineaceae bacterium]|nr:uroporphyrinogen-III synthase [Anaerolineaceae bacterium]
MNLQGKRVLVTRAAHQAGPLCDLLRERGALPLQYPCLAVEPAPDRYALDAVLYAAMARRFDWLLLTSSNSVAALAERLRNPDISLPRSKLALMGAAITAAAELLPDLRPRAQAPAGDRAGLLSAMGVKAGTRVLLLQSDVAPPDTADALRAAGARVTSVAAWRNVPGRGGVDLPALLRAGEVDGLLFTSASIVRNALTRLHAEGGELALLQALPVACLGRPTADAAQQAGFRAVELADAHSMASLLDALARHWHTDP